MIDQEFEFSLNTNVKTENARFDECGQKLIYSSSSCNMKPDDVFSLARAFLSISAMTHKKLQKLCYYAKAWYLAIYDSNIINEPFEAWVHGAVQPELYRKYRIYGFSDIPKEVDRSNIPEEFLSFAREVYDAYGHLNGDELERLNHNEDPWREARGTCKPWEKCNNVISETTMKLYYRERLK